MGDFPILLVMLIVYLIVASSGKKKKKDQKQRRPRAAKAVRDMDDTFAAPPREADCEERPIHLHAVTQAQMERAGEGEDPCHAGGAAPQIMEKDDQEKTDALAQDVLRGVIMSEILTRPQDRAAMRRNRQGYHG